MSATQVKCSECNKTVYMLEKVSIADGRSFHSVKIDEFTTENQKRFTDRLINRFVKYHFIIKDEIFCYLTL